MSTETLPVEMPTREEYDDLLERSGRNQRRGRRAQALALLAVVLVLAVAVSGGAVYLAQKDVPGVQRRQGETLAAIRHVVTKLDESNRTSAADNRRSALALSVIVGNLAAFAATPPAPDPARLKAVEGLCATAQEFRVAAGAAGPPPVCPAL